MCNRVLLFLGKLPQWNLLLNCHVNGTTFQSGSRFQTGLSSLRVSCKRALILKNISVQVLLKMCSWNWEELQFIRSFTFTLKNRYFEHHYQKQVKIYVFTSWLVSFGVCIYMQYFFDVMRNKLPELIKRRSKIQEINMSCERVLNFDQWKTFSENYNPIRVRLWLVYKFTENYCGSRFLEVSYLSWQNTYPNFETTRHVKLKLFLWTQLLKNLLLAKYLRSVAAPLNLGSFW